MNNLRGVFNFSESFPGPHMLRVRLTKDQAWSVLRELSIRLEQGGEEIDFAWFGELTRDAEEDAGNSINVES